MLTRNLQVTDPDAARTLTKRRKGWKKFVLYNSPAFSWLVVIFFITTLPSSNFGESHLFSGDKVIHALIFFILVTLQMQGLIKQQLFPRLRYEAGFYALIYGFFISGLTEIMQGLLLTSRSADPYDYIANTVGCIAGWLFFTFFILQKQ
jgi:glycopeptide antibiotics resistance protein